MALTNSQMTLYHKIKENHNYVWKRYNFDKVWWFGGKGTSRNKGYDNANDVEVRIFYANEPNLDIKTFAIGDIIVKGHLAHDIQGEADLAEERYNITSINNNDFGNSQHIHLGGR